MDGAGDTYLAGSFMGTVDFDPSEAGVAMLTASDTSNAFVARLDPLGGLDWVLPLNFHVSLSTITTHLILGAAGTPYVCGAYEGSTDYGVVGGATFANVGQRYPFLMRLDPSNGQTSWATVVRGSAGNAAWANDAAVGADGCVYLTGRFEGVADFDRTRADHGGRDVLASRGDLEGFVLKLDAGGGFQKVWRMGGTGVDTAVVAAVAQGAYGPQVRAAGILNSPTADYPTGEQLQNPDDLAGGVRGGRVGGRGKRRADGPHLHRLPVLAVRRRDDHDLPDDQRHRDRREQLRGGERDTDIRPGGDEEDRCHLCHRGHDQRGRRDVLPGPDLLVVAELGRPVVPLGRVGQHLEDHPRVEQGVAVAGRTLAGRRR